MTYPNLSLIAPLNAAQRSAAQGLTLAPVTYPNGYSADLSAVDKPVFVSSQKLYQVSLAAGQDASIDLNGYALTYGGSQVIIVYDPDGRPLDAADVSTAGAQLSFTPSTSGGYFIEVRYVVTGSSISSSASIIVSVDTKVAGLLGNDNLQGSQLDGGPGYDSLTGTTGADTLYGGEGNDAVNGGAGEDYLRGDAGNDMLWGGDAHDDINGNTGADTASGGPGDDWVVGGKDNDSVTGDAGDDLVYGNLGSDTCDGGAGNDIVRGGQQDDVIRGGLGNDWLSGDLGADTMTGGGGADTFHSFGTAGLDLVTDFNQFEGDSVRLDPGTSYTVLYGRPGRKRRRHYDVRRRSHGAGRCHAERAADRLAVRGLRGDRYRRPRLDTSSIRGHNTGLHPWSGLRYGDTILNSTIEIVETRILDELSIVSP